MVINLKKDKNVRTPPVIKEPRPLLTMGDVWNVAFTVVAFLLQKASGAILTFVKIPYNAVNGVIKAIGNAEERFKEDALRMLRAIRFSCQLGFEIEESDTISR